MATIKRENPECLFVVGLDSGFLEGEPGYNPELVDSERIDGPKKPFFELVATKGIPDQYPVSVVLVPSPGEDFGLPSKGKCKVIVDGRQRVLAARLVNKTRGEDDLLTVPYVVVPESEATALDVLAANEMRRIDDPIQKGARIRYLRTLGYDDDSICSHFQGENGGKISPVTLRRWASAASCAPEIIARFRKKELPLEILVELGATTDFEVQKRALAYLTDKEISGVVGKQNAREALKAATAKPKAEPKAEPRTEPRTEPKAEPRSEPKAEPRTEPRSEPKAEPRNEQKSEPKFKKRAFTPKQLESLAYLLSEEGGEQFDDFIKAGTRDYKNGDFQRLAWLIISWVQGDRNEALREYPSVYPYVNKCAG